MANKERDAKARIAAAHDKAVKEISAMTTEVTIKAVKDVLRRQLTEKEIDRLIDESIDII